MMMMMIHVRLFMLTMTIYYDQNNTDSRHG